MSPTRDDVLAALREVPDPEIPAISVVDLVRLQIAKYATRRTIRTRQERRIIVAAQLDDEQGLRKRNQASCQESPATDQTGELETC